MIKKPVFRRRSLLLGSLAAAAGVTALLRPGDRGENHNAYFQGLGTALDEAQLSGPTLVVDKARLDANIQTLRRHIGGRYDYRIVAKSLPSVPLLKHAMVLSGSQRLMLFHQPFINEVARKIPDADVLLGKPMPVAAARNFYREHDAAGLFDPQRRLHWLIDTPARMREYRLLAEQLDQDLSICIELNVGLERGGVSDDAELAAILEMIQQSPRLTFAGLMGYEPHIVKLPGDSLAYRDSAMSRYRHYLRLARQQLGKDWPIRPILNAGGSPTYQLYDEGEFPFNELAAGSALVKPTDFDIASLADHQPASFIATPVLKVADTVRVPELPVGRLQSLWDTNRSQSFFTYGGYWKALPESPRGLSHNPLFGRSTNQEMLNGSDSISLAPDDWIFLRPTQSEFVFLQFGDIAVYENGRIEHRWPVFEQSGGAAGDSLRLPQAQAGG